MDFLDKLERRLGFLAIPNPTLFIIVGQVCAWALSLAQPELIEMMYFEPGKVLEGEFWRIFSFPFIPPLTDAIWLLFAWYIFWMMGSALEAQWGEFRFTAYLILGALLGMGASFLIPGLPISNIFWGQTVFLAFAHLFPDFELRLFFVIPVKVRWLGWLVWAQLLYIGAGAHWLIKLFLVASVLNYFIFFGRDIVDRIRSKKRKAELKAAKKIQAATPFHVCSVCGATDLSHADRDFRYRGDDAICTDCIEKEKTTPSS